MGSDEKPNPWGREYSPLEWASASEMWPQYREKRSKGSGPLVFMSPAPLVDEIDEAVEATKRRAGKLAILQRAIHREAKKGRADAE